MDEQGQPPKWSISVHYANDLDDVDQEWLDAINAERRKEHLDKVSYELFEIIMDRLEKEWFDLVGHRCVSSGYPYPDYRFTDKEHTQTRFRHAI